MSIINKRPFRTHIRRALSLSVIILMFNSSSCGYLLHPKRVGQTGGNIDPAILVLDAAGLLFGVLPGVVAFAVDITTGAIYLSPGEKSVIDKHKNNLALPLFPSFSQNLIKKRPLSAAEETLFKLNRNEIAKRLTLYTNRTINSKNLRFHKPLSNTITVAGQKLQVGRYQG
ncbi:hypothetical protein A9Q81_21370 [Gammaproteobacteria bacterium 42_54_T18]|nr:hypothetical protein A9Q81_21370 [Gammaproteobacteria bacterium 42_54_T18]